VLKSESLNLEKHQPILLSEALEALNLRSDGIYVDCTFGRGGHSLAILNALGSSGQVHAFDQDPDAIQAAQALCLTDKRFSIVHSPFAQLSPYIEKCGLTGKVNGILLDLGVSSPQLEISNRGFSFMRDGPLDMRMNPEMGESVAQWLSKASASDIAHVLKTYGEERFARRIARAIVIAREQKALETTSQLADIIAAASPPPPKGKRKEFKHPATRSFQALRIFINHELEQLQQVLPQVLDVLVSGGRLVVISFHSLEDRIVKRFIRDEVRGDDFPLHIAITTDMLDPRLRVIGKPLFPNAVEIAKNRRARSAIMRVAERC